jgi:hypothetical protein
MKKILSILSVFFILFTTSFASYSSTEMIDSANNLAERSVITDRSENPSAYNLNDNVLRQEIGLIAMRIAGLDKKISCSGIF